MKTLKEIYDGILASDELKREYLEAAGNGGTMEFLREHGCEATEEELKAFLEGERDGELSDGELDNVAGGACNKTTAVESVISVFSGGIACLAISLDSRRDGSVGQKGDQDGRLCSEFSVK